MLTDIAVSTTVLSLETRSAQAVAQTGTAAMPSGLFTRLALALRIRAERRALKELDARLLTDIGIDRDVVRAEASRSTLDVPKSRL